MAAHRAVTRIYRRQWLGGRPPSRDLRLPRQWLGGRPPSRDLSLQSSVEAAARRHRRVGLYVGIGDAGDGVVGLLWLASCSFTACAMRCSIDNINTIYVICVLMLSMAVGM